MDSFSWVWSQGLIGVKSQRTQQGVSQVAKPVSISLRGTFKIEAVMIKVIVRVNAMRK